MIYRILLLTFFSFNFSLASFQEVRVGKIDSYYKNKITEQELRNIIDEIEYTFESKLNIDIFDYSDENGKAIDLIYLPPSKLENRISNKIKRIKSKKEKIASLETSFPKKTKEIEYLKEKYSKNSNAYNKRIKAFNKYIKEVNSKKQISKKEYTKIKNYEKSQKLKFKIEVKKLNKELRYLRQTINRHNQKIISFNNQIHEYNRLNNEVESMSRGHKKIKGRTFGLKHTRIETSFKNGKKITTKSDTTKMNKIEIYGFNNLSELKAIIAHEIAHLVGIPHINKEGALMNPILQINQLEKLELTNNDIETFILYF